jgi:hypothetical protein
MSHGLTLSDPTFTSLSNIMKYEVKLYVAGKVFTEEVQAANYEDARETAIARNPKAKVIGVNPRP